jgi:Uma2 family endonuclease
MWRRIVWKQRFVAGGRIQMGAVRHRFTVGEYRLMEEAGIFSEDDRVELIDGEVVEMAPIGGRHVESVMRLTRLLVEWSAGRYAVSVQNPLSLSEHWEPQPDLALVRRSEGRSGVPVSEDVLLVIEVAATSLAHDRDLKLPLYAEAGIPEAWILDLDSDTITAYYQPGTGGYTRSTRVGRGDRLTSATIPDLALDADEALPPAE